MRLEDASYGTVKNGVLALSGYVSSITVEHGCLVVRDGIAGNIVERRWGRAQCPIVRLISTQSEGYISFRAIRWLHEIGATMTHLAYDGTPLVTSVAKPRVGPILRKQIRLSSNSDKSRVLEYRLLEAKLKGQADILNQLYDNQEPSFQIQQYAGRLTGYMPHEEMLGIEGMAAQIYWKQLGSEPIRFAATSRVPTYWGTFGRRLSPLTKTPRHAITPGNAVLNYLYNVAISEIIIALHTFNLEPSLGIIHSYNPPRPSLAYDLIEPLRPMIDLWAFKMFRRMTFTKRDFIEDIQGGLRIQRPLSSHLAETSAIWRSLASDVASWFRNWVDGKPLLRFHFGNLEAIKFNGQVKKMRDPMPKACAKCGSIVKCDRCGG